MRLKQCWKETGKKDVCQWGFRGFALKTTAYLFIFIQLDKTGESSRDGGERVTEIGPCWWMILNLCPGTFSLSHVCFVCVCVGLCVLSFLTLYWKASAWSTHQGFCLEKSRESVEVRNTFVMLKLLFSSVYSVCVYVCACVFILCIHWAAAPPVPLNSELQCQHFLWTRVFVLAFAIRRIMLHSFQRTGSCYKKMSFEFVLQHAHISAHCLNFNTFYFVVFLSLTWKWKREKQNYKRFIWINFNIV